MNTEHRAHTVLLWLWQVDIVSIDEHLSSYYIICDALKHTPWCQFIHQVCPHSTRVVQTGNWVCFAGSTQRMVLKPCATSIEANCCISMPRHGSTLIREHCIALYSICDYNSLICIGLKCFKNHYCAILISFDEIITLSALNPYSATLFHSATNIQDPAKFVEVCCRINLFTTDRSSMFLLCTS